MTDLQNTVVVILDFPFQANAAIKALHRAGIDIEKLSIVGKDHHTEENLADYYDADDGAKYRGKTAAFWGVPCGAFFDPAFFWVEGLGSLVVSGPLADWDSIIRYDGELRSDKLLVVSHGTPDEARRAKAILERTPAGRSNAHMADAC